jgi:hypothetical protein
LTFHIIIEAIEFSEWVSPIVVVQKKYGNIRICTDLRMVNAAIIEEKHPIPDIDTLLSEMHGAN